MKIEIKNLGPIHAFNFDSEKDFHIIYGENNIGKSYAVTAIYILLKNIIGEENVFSKILINSFFGKRSYHKDFYDIVNRGQDDQEYFDITKFSEKILFDCLNDTLIPTLQKGFDISFSNFEYLQNRLSGAEFEMKIILNSFSFSIKLNEKSKLSLNFCLFSIPIQVKKDGINSTHFEIHHPNYKSEKLIFHPHLNLLDAILEVLFLDLQDALLFEQNPYYLPASRSGLYQAMNIFGAVFAKLSQIRYAVKTSIEIPSLSEPMSDYFLRLSTINVRQKEDIFTEIALEIEDEILQGSVIFNDETKKIEYYENATSLRLDLSETSSMVSEISPLVAFLKYVISEKDSTKVKNSKHIIFIEEPEAHLHPKIQIKLVEIFAKLAKNNVKIAMTTHSDYIYNKVTNLILSNELDFNTVESCHLVKSDKGSYDAGDMIATAQGIDDHNFLQTAELMYEERMNLINS